MGDDHLNIREMVLDALFAALPVLPLCRRDCRGDMPPVRDRPQYGSRAPARKSSSIPAGRRSDVIGGPRWTRRAAGAAGW